MLNVLIPSFCSGLSTINELFCWKPRASPDSTVWALIFLFLRLSLTLGSSISIMVEQVISLSIFMDCRLTTFLRSKLG